MRTKVPTFTPDFPLFSELDANFESRLTQSWHKNGVWDLLPYTVNVPRGIGIKLHTKNQWAAIYFAKSVVKNAPNESKDSVRSRYMKDFFQRLTSHGFSVNETNETTTWSNGQITLQKQGDITFILTAPQGTLKAQCLILENLLHDLYGSK